MNRTSTTTQGIMDVILDVPPGDNVTLVYRAQRGRNWARQM